jgi:hypothetical protein
MLPALAAFCIFMSLRTAFLVDIVERPLVPLELRGVEGIIWPSERFCPDTLSREPVVGVGSCGRSGAPGTGEIVDWAWAEVVARLIKAKATSAHTFFIVEKQKQWIIKVL